MKKADKTYYLDDAYKILTLHLADIYRNLKDNFSDENMSMTGSLFHRDSIIEMDKKFSETMELEEIENEIMENSQLYEKCYQITTNISLFRTSYRIIYFLPLRYINVPLELKLDNSFKLSLIGFYKKIYKNIYKTYLSEYIKIDPKILFDKINMMSNQTLAYMIIPLPNDKKYKFLEILPTERKNYIESILNSIQNINRLLLFDFIDNIRCMWKKS